MRDKAKFVVRELDEALGVLGEFWPILIMLGCIAIIVAAIVN